MSVLVGTSGWGYTSWQPGFYPAGLDRSEFLSFYSGRLHAVELNATKYRLPSEEQFRTWAAQVPDGELVHPFLKTFGQPARASACECEREADTTLEQALQIVETA